MLWFRPSTSLPGWVACVPQGDSATLALVERRTDERPAVHWVAEERWGQQPAGTLRALRRRHSIQRHHRVLQLDRRQYRMTTMDAPPEVPRTEWPAAVRWMLKDAVDFPVDSAAIDVLAVPEGTSYRAQPQLIAVAAAEEAVRPLVELAHGVGMPWDAIDIPETALRNLSALVETEGRAHALLHCELDQSTLVVTYRGELLASRHFELTLAALTTDDDEARQRAFDQIGLELQRTLDGIERSYGQVALSRLAITPMPGLEALCDHLGPLLYVPVHAFDALSVLDLSAVPALADDVGVLNRHLRAIGAALRQDA